MDRCARSWRSAALVRCPEHGCALWQLAEHKPVLYGSTAAGIAAMQTNLFHLPCDRNFGLIEAITLFAVTPEFFATLAIFMASQQQFVLNNLCYSLTDRRRIVCARVRRRLAVRWPSSGVFPFGCRMRLFARAGPSLQLHSQWPVTVPADWSAIRCGLCAFWLVGAGW